MSKMPKAAELTIRYDKEPNHIHVAEGLEKGLQLLHRSSNRVYGYYRIIDCGHELFLHYGAIRKAKTRDFKCKQCLEIKCKEEAEKVGLEFISFGDKTNKATYRVKKCGHINEFAISNIRFSVSESYGCPICEKERIEQYAKNCNMILHKDVEPDSNNRRLCTLSCGHQKWVSVSAMREKSVRCRICQDDKYEKDADEQGIVYLRGVKASHHDLRVYKLPCGCIKEITPPRVRDGAFECKTHDIRKLDKNRPIYVYLIMLTLPIGNVLKVGHAADLFGKNNRYVRYGVGRGNVHPFVEAFFEDGQMAINFEKYLHSKFDNFNIESDILRKHMENGFTECYPTYLLDELHNEFLKLEPWNLCYVN